MEIRPSEQSGGLSPTQASRTGVHRPQPPADQVDLGSSAALNRALRETPPTRPEEVERARQLVASPTYPPQETIQSLAHLLAMMIPKE